MPNPIITRDEVWEGNDPAWTLAQIPGRDSMLLQVADVTSVDVCVYDKTTGLQLYTANIGPGLVFTDVPVKDDRWTEDDIGFNFSHYLEHDLVFAVTDMEGMHTYRVEYIVHTTALNGSGNLKVVREFFCVPAFST